MGRIGVVQSYERVTDEGENVAEVKVDVGGGEIIKPSHFSAPGLDAPPLPGDYVATVGAPGGVGQVAVGYADPVNEQLAEGGEWRIIGRDSSGNIVCEVWLEADGSIVISNDNGTVTMAANGQFNVNDNFTVDP